MNERRGKETDVLAATSTRSDDDAHGAGATLDDIFRDHHRLVFQSAYRVTGNSQDAEDVLQTVFLRLARRDSGHGLDDNPAGYLHRAAVNAALDIVRSRKTAKSSPLDDLEPVLPDGDPNRDPERRADGGEILGRIREALGRLNPRTAEVFTLRYIEGYGNHEIADMLGTSRSTIAVMLHRARHKLKDEIRAFAEDAS